MNQETEKYLDVLDEHIDNSMTIFEFTEELCDIIGGEDAYYRFEKDELIEMCKAMSESHRKVTDKEEVKS